MRKAGNMCIHQSLSLRKPPAYSKDIARYVIQRRRESRHARITSARGLPYAAMPIGDGLPGPEIVPAGLCHEPWPAARQRHESSLAACVVFAASRIRSRANLQSIMPARIALAKYLSAAAMPFLGRKRRRKLPRREPSSGRSEIKYKNN